MASEPESVASHVFAINELLLLIISYLAPPGKALVSSIDADSLANLARVSRAISEAALDALWRRMDRPDAIAGLLPSDSYSTRSGHYRLLRPLNSNDFAVFDKYAPRIHCVDFTNSSRVLARGCELFPYIQEFRDPMLPSLDEFRWEPSVTNGSIGALYLLSSRAAPPIEEFTLMMWSEIEHSPGESDSTAATIDAFNHPGIPWFPDVKRLTLRTFNYLPTVRTAVQRFGNLEYFSCDLRVDAPLFEHLAALHRLRSIDLRNLPADAAKPSTDSQSFRALQDLRISGAISSISAFLPLISSPDLASVHLSPRDQAAESIDAALFDLLLSPSLPTRISTLKHFSLTSPMTAQPGRLRLVAAAFSPLYACHALQTFRVDANPKELALCDEDVRAMATAWPALTTFYISPPRVSGRPAPDVHLYILWALTAACPRLSYIALEVDAEVAEPFRVEDEEVLVGVRGRARMETLTLFCSPCGDPILVADFLQLAFPGLIADRFHAYPAVSRPDDRQRWAAVTDALTGWEAGLVGSTTKTTVPLLGSHALLLRYSPVSRKLDN